MSDLSNSSWPYEAVEPGSSAVEPKQFACKLGNDNIRARSRELDRTFRPGILEREELEDGCVYWFDRTDEWFEKVTHFAWFESRCCDFLDFGVGLCASGKRISLRISGPPGHMSRMYEVLDAAAASTR